MERIRISHTQISAFLRCRRRWYYSRRLKPKVVPDYMEVGVIFHGVLQEFYNTKPEERDMVAILDRRLYGMVLEGEVERKTRDLVRVYEHAYGKDEQWVAHAEIEWVVEGDGFTFIFKPDLIVSHEGRLVLVEHKTTSKDPQSYAYDLEDYDAQGVRYLAGFHALGIPIREIIYNVVSPSKCYRHLVQYSDSAIAYAWKEIEEVAKEMREVTEERALLSWGMWCVSCPYKLICQAERLGGRLSEAEIDYYFDREANEEEVS